MTQVKSFTGYGENTIRNWINKGILRYLDCIAGWRIPKTWLLQFLCSEYYTFDRPPFLCYDVDTKRNGGQFYAREKSQNEVFGL